MSDVVSTTSETLPTTSSASVTPLENAPTAPSVAKEPVRCALTGRELTAEEAYWAPPLVTVGQLLNTLWTTVTKNPAMLSNVLFDEQPNVPYAPEARELLAQRRTTEQAKLLGLLLLIVALIVVPIYMVVTRG